jgi:hypothetical protein
MLVHDGLVMAADSQQTYNEFDIDAAPKISLQAAGKSRLVMCGSGQTHIIEYGKSEILNVARKSSDIDDFESKLSTLMENLYLYEFGVYPADQSQKEISLLVGCQFFNRQPPVLFSVDSTVVNRETVRVIGDERGSWIAKHFWSMNLSASQAEWACLYVINAAKNRSTVVGGSTYLVSWGEGGIHFDNGEISGAQIDQFMTRFDNLSKRIFIGVIPPTSDRLFEAELQNTTDLLRASRNELKYIYKESQDAAAREHKLAVLMRHRIQTAIEEDKAEKEAAEEKNIADS